MIRYLVLTILLVQIAQIPALESHFCGSIPGFLDYATSLYDGKDSIYFMTDNIQSRIFKFNIHSNQSEVIGHLPKDGRYSTLLENGDILYITNSNPNVFRIHFGSNGQVSQVTDEGLMINKRNLFAGVQIDDSIYLIGGDTDQYGLAIERNTTIEVYNMITKQSQIVATFLPSVEYLSRVSAVYDGEYVYIFGGGNHYVPCCPVPANSLDTIFRFNPKTNELIQLEERLPSKYSSSAALLLGNKILVIPNHETDQTGKITIFTPKNRNVKEVVVEGLQRSGDVPLATYLKSQNRIYTSPAAYIYNNGIWSTHLSCIDLTNLFTCEDNENGDYPHPSECTKFITCSNGNTYERNCPHDLHFNAETSTCDYQENANCEN